MIVPRRSGTNLGRLGRSLSTAAEGDNEIAVAGDVERRHRHLQAGEGRQQLPVAIDVPVPVQAAAKTGALELFGVILRVLVRQPGRQRRRAGQAPEEAALARAPCRPARRVRGGAMLRPSPRRAWREWSHTDRAQAPPRPRRAPGNKADRTPRRRPAASWWSAASTLAAGTARSGRSRRESGRGAAAPRARRPARPNRDRQSPRFFRLKHPATRPCRRPDAAACIFRFRREHRCGHSRACPGRPRGSRLRPRPGADGARNTRTSGKP